MRNFGLEDPRFGELEDKRRGKPILPIVAWYEALPAKLRLGLEANLRAQIERRQHDLTAREVFATLADLTPGQEAQAENNLDDLLASLVREIAGIWRSSGIRVGRTNIFDDRKALGPFPEFIERVLLSQFHASFNYFNRPNEEQMEQARLEYYKLDKDERTAGSASPYRGHRLISDRLLRRVLKTLAKNNSQTSM